MKNLKSAACIAVFALTAPAHGGEVVLNAQSAYPSRLPILGATTMFLAEQVARVSGGGLTLRFYEPGGLSPPSGILDAVSSGAADVGFSSAGFWGDKIPAAPIFSAAPFGPEAPEFLAWLYHGGGLVWYQKMYDQYRYNVKVLPCGILPPETSGWFKQKIVHPSQLQGLDIRFFGLGGEVMKKLGARPVWLPGDETFAALAQGRIDAAEFSLPAIDERLEFHTIAPHNYFPGWHQQATVLELLVNKTVWRDKLSERRRAILEIVCLASMTNSLAAAEAAQPAAMERQAKNGVSREYWNDEMLAAFESAWKEVLAERRRDAFFAEVWDDLAAFRRDYAVWRKKAFLPRDNK